MSTVISDFDFRPSISPMIDQQFDLDEVLALAEERFTSYEGEDHHHQITIVSEASRNLLVVDFVTTSTVDVDSCAVCMESFHSGETVGRTTCGHVYHESCIASWLSICNSCPLCRRRATFNFCVPENI